MEIVGGEETLREGFFNFQFEKEFIFKLGKVVFKIIPKVNATMEETFRINQVFY